MHERKAASAATRCAALASSPREAPRGCEPLRSASSQYLLVFARPRLALEIRWYLVQQPAAAS